MKSAPCPSKYRAPRLAVSLATAAVVFGLPSQSDAAVVLSGGGLALLEEGPAAASSGGAAPMNLASGKTAFALGELGLGTHFIANVTNGTYGNSSSWIGNTGDMGVDGPFIGVNLAGSFDIAQIAFGRSNVLAGDPCLGGVCTDRHLGLYTLQYTQVAGPNASFNTTGDASTGWVTIGTLDYQSAGGTNFAAPHQRHLYSFDPVTATGVRLIVPGTGIGADGTAIDEIEIYAVPEPSGAILFGAAGLALVFRRRRSAGRA